MPGEAKSSPAQEPQDVEAPLLSTMVVGGGEQQEGRQRRESGQCAGTCSVAGGVANLTITAVGAGMLALPKAYASVGILTAFGIFAFVCLLTFFSTSTIVKYAAQHKTRSYGELIKREFGGTGQLVLQLAIVTHVGGVMVIYLIIIADMLVGSAPQFGGVLPELFNRHDNPWWLSRAFVAGALVCGVIAPMLVPRNLATVSRFSRCSVAMILLLAGTITTLALTALAKGSAAPDVRLWPDISISEGGGVLGPAITLLSVVAVVTTAFSQHFNLLPIQHSLQDPRYCVMLTVIRRTLVLCASFYTLVALSGYVLFGSKTEGDVLKNLNVSFVSSLVPRALAQALIYGVMLAYTFNLLVNFVLKVWAVRENVSEIAFRHSALQLSNCTYYKLTAALVLTAFAISVVIPSVWVLISLVGSTACALFSFVFPGLLVLKNEKCPVRRGAAGGMVVLAACMAGIAIYNNLRGAGGV